MTRIRYTHSAPGQRKSKNMLAGNQMVYVLDNSSDKTFQVVNADTSEVLTVGSHGSKNVRMKLIKSALTSLGVLFQQEVRERKKTATEATTEVA